MSVKRPSRARVGTFQLTPIPPKNPFFACAVIPTVARVRFSVVDTNGGNVRSAPRISVALSIVAVSLDTAVPFNSPTTRRKLRDGKVSPAPQRNAPVGVSNPVGLPRHS